MMTTRAAVDFDRFDQFLGDVPTPLGCNARFALNTHHLRRSLFSSSWFKYPTTNGRQTTLAAQKTPKTTQRRAALLLLLLLLLLSGDLPVGQPMGLWADLFKQASRDHGALLAPGRRYTVGGAPNFPDLGHSLLVSNGEPLQLSTIVGAGKPSIVLIYSNC